MADALARESDQVLREEIDFREAARRLIDGLERDALDRVSKRQTVERRWIEDLRHYNSEYDPKMVAELKAADKSQLFVNKTRPKTDACEARLSDMLFPTDEDNWDVQPTPVPEMVDTAEAGEQQAAALTQQANEAKRAGDPAHGDLAEEAQGFASTTQRLREEMDEAQRRAGAMKAEIKDQFVECNYNQECRDVIRDACRIGTGVIVGPVGVTERSRRAWRKRPPAVEGGAAVFELEMRADSRPAFYRLDPWSWFPEADARTPEDSDSFFERHLKTDKMMRALAKEPGFDKDAIRRLLRDGAKRPLPTYLANIREITGENPSPFDERFQVWVYRGPLASDKLRIISEATGDTTIAAPFLDGNDIDPLAEISVVIWFCQGEVLKFGVHQLDSNESLYSVFNLSKDDGSIWGYGVPYIMRNSQKALNAAWRMMMDNAGLASGPQIIVDRSVGEPSDGFFHLTSRKVWLRFRTAILGKPLIESIDIPMHQAELANIISLAVRFIDDETAISVLAQGEQGATTKTMGGMALLMNSVNVMFRRMVRAFDDDVTVPNVRRIYDWNMQFSRKEHIKGDFNVDARGSSVLLVREIQAQNLMLLLGLSDKPDLGLMLKKAPLLRKTVQSMMIPSDEVVASDDEWKQILKDQANQKPEIPPEVQGKVQVAQMDNETRLQTAMINREVELMRLAQMHNITLDQLKSRLQIKGMELASDERKLAVEVAVEAEKDARGDETGSGGTLS